MFAFVNLSILCLSVVYVFAQYEPESFHVITCRNGSDFWGNRTFVQSCNQKMVHDGKIIT